jgi:formylglycine-generating enzyme required for sulfatase activity
MNTNMKKKLYLTLFASLFAYVLSANNITVSNLTLKGQDSANDFTFVQFDLTWDNSWRTTTGPSNWDAAWVFVKFRMGAGAWQHAFLNNTGHVVPAGSTIDTGLLTPANAFNISSNPGLGAFIYRTSSGSGSVSLTGVQLKWNYGANGVLDSDKVDVQVFAVEMVYVTTGAFVAGDGATDASQFTLTTINTASSNTAPSGSGSLGGQGGGYPTGQTVPNASWPNGYNAFYSMKYKVTQQQYVDFLNTVTVTQAANLYDVANVNLNRYSITSSGGIFSTTKPYVACNFLKWSDLAAILDWMALRPMTELEYEKACRGAGQTAVTGEYAWGTTTATAATGILNDGLANETASNAGANATFNGNTIGPLRVGVYATSASSRTQSGATYYGIMEMSGTLWEQPITIGMAEGRAYTGTHGNGLLTSGGNADASTWPDAIGVGSGNRGGCWVHSEPEIRVSHRAEATSNNQFRLSYRGGRGIRTAP